MGRSCICIDVYAMKQMWIDKRKINTLETFIRQSLSNPIENTSIVRHFFIKLVDEFSPFQISVYINTKIPTMVNISNFDTSNLYVNFIFPLSSKSDETIFFSKFKLNLFATNHWKR